MCAGTSKLRIQIWSTWSSHSRFQGTGWETSWRQGWGLLQVGWAWRHHQNSTLHRWPPERIQRCGAEIWTCYPPCNSSPAARCSCLQERCVCSRSELLSSTSCLLFWTRFRLLQLWFHLRFQLWPWASAWRLWRSLLNAIHFQWTSVRLNSFSYCPYRKLHSG